LISDAYNSVCHAESLFLLWQEAFPIEVVKIRNTTRRDSGKKCMDKAGRGGHSVLSTLLQRHRVAGMLMLGKSLACGVPQYAGPILADWGLQRKKTPRRG
jgi:hypothetical protein